MTVTLDADVYSFTSAYAKAKRLSLSAAIGELIRHAEHSPMDSGTLPAVKRSPHGYLVIAHGGKAITSEMVSEAAEDELV